MSLSHYIKPLLRGTLVLGAVVLITSLSVDATDTFRTSQSALGIFARYATTPGCPDGMVPFSVDGKSLCIDVYENSVGDTCVVPEPVSAQETSVNVNDADCVPQSKIGRMPWRFVSEVQAAQLCARAHKRLPTNIEWFTAAAGTPDGNGNCVLTGAIAVAGQKSSCISGIGALDMIGNVWEFVSGEVVDGKMLTDTVPGEGYVQAVRSDGLPNATGRDPVPMYNSDYFWSNASGTYAIMRGGFYSSGTDGGIYSAHAAVLQNFSSAAAGFRCVSELPR